MEGRGAVRRLGRYSGYRSQKKLGSARVFFWVYMVSNEVLNWVYGILTLKFTNLGLSSIRCLEEFRVFVSILSIYFCVF